jgi:ABC-2 type transport system permease protein
VRSISLPLAAEAPTPAALHTLASIAEAARLGALGAFAGWPVLAGRAVFYVVAMVVLSALWAKVAAEHLPDTLSHALPAGGFALYLGVSEWIVLSIPSIHLRLEDDIRSGAVETGLLKPKPHLALRIAETLGEMAARLTMLGAVGIGLLVFVHASVAPEGLAFGALFGVGGGVIGVLIVTLAGLTGFWVRRTLPAYLIVQKLMFLMGGLFAPISLYPLAFRAVCEASPFAAEIYWPAHQLIAPSAEAAAAILVLQAIWVVLLSLATAGLWRAGVAKALREGI